MKHYAEILTTLRAAKPLVHHITNYVTVNDCANATLAVGASPIMADDTQEAADIAGMASALVLNMGTLNTRTIESMRLAGRAANQAGIPVVLDPVGAGASGLRNETAAMLLCELRISVLRGNLSEIRFLAGLQAQTRGVDVSEQDLEQTGEAAGVARALSAQLGCVVAITGKTDVVASGMRAVRIENGHEMLSRLTGTGCMCSSLIGSFCGASPQALFEATVAALLTMGISGEIAYENAGAAGNGSFRIALHDALSQMDAERLEKGGRIYEA